MLAQMIGIRQFEVESEETFQSAKDNKQLSFLKQNTVDHLITAFQSQNESIVTEIEKQIQDKEPIKISKQPNLLDTTKCFILQRKLTYDLHDWKYRR